MAPSPIERTQQLLGRYRTGDVLPSPAGMPCECLDARRLYADKGRFEKYFRAAQRVEPVYVWQPKPGDRILESGRKPATATGNETVFLKKLGGGGLKVYIPSDSRGPLDASILDGKYEPGIAARDAGILTALPEGASIVERRPKMLAIDILQEAIDRPSVIRDARGPGKHQFMLPGDSLKFEDGECLPLPKAELDTAWNVSPKGRAM